jgi:hypothetical protein
MVVINLPSNSTYSNLYTLTSYTAGLSLIITNNTSSPAFIVQQTSQPVADSDQYPLLPGQTILVHGNDDPIWIRGGNGPLIVQSILETITPFTGIDLPRDLYTSDNEGFRRLRVDAGQTSFFEGREARTFKELNVAAAATYVIKAVVPLNIILFDLTVVLDDGGLRVTTLVGGTEGGTFSETLPILNKNNMTSRPTPFYTPQVILTAGGTHTGGTSLDIVRVVAATATAQRSSVGSGAFDERGVLAGTYYFRLENISSSAATGTFSAWWEERP